MSDDRPDDKKPSVEPTEPKEAETSEPVRAALKHTMTMQAVSATGPDGEPVAQHFQEASSARQHVAPKLDELPELLRNRALHSQRPPGTISSVIPSNIATERTETEPEALPSDAPKGLVATLHGQTDVGLVREHNEDNFIAFDATSGTLLDASGLTISIAERGAVFAVCDGMGGAAAGEVASQMAVDTIFEMMRADAPLKERDDFARRLVRAVEEAGSRIFANAKSNKSQRGMGTTSTVAGLVDKVLFVGQVGDSRAYVLRGSELRQITKDQSLITQLIEAGQLTEEEAENFEFSNIILQALGTAATVAVDLTFLELRRGDRLMLCSDGLSGLVHPQTMRDVLLNVRDARGACATLIEMARNAGGHDNITVIVVDFDGADLPLPDDQRVAYQQYPLVPLPQTNEPRSPSNWPQSPQAESTSEEARRDERSSSWRIALALLVLAALAVVAFWLGGGASSSEPSGETSPAAAPATETLVPAPPRTFAVSVRTDIPNASLFVDGEFKLTLEPGVRKPLELAAGAYRFEARVDGNAVATSQVTVGDGSPDTVELMMPAGAREAADVEAPPSAPPVQ